LEWQIELRKRNRLVAEDKERQKKERESMKNVRDLEVTLSKTGIVYQKYQN
jgi:hypothetical protein